MEEHKEHKYYHKQEKEKIRDSKGYRLRVDCVCYKDTAKKEVLLVSSHKFKDGWIIPGGGVELNESYNAATLREAREEGGVIGYVEGCLGTYCDDVKMTRTTAYNIIVTSLEDTWEDKHNDSFPNGGRFRKWFSVSEAVQHLTKHGKTYKKVAYFSTATTNRIAES